ncbi:CRISPR-associated helicase/endonuclease Cas3 [Limosilactobacillus fermentum]|uniref:CRISPR-associated helicase/endonuclease Cas3 n=2 Tax=Limosilactobacillus fermentum TaxID=1613 RepID=A0A1L7GXA1_LIMFE|nr:CRISPR-associated helicase/endonuclease Cas3 [Limosilactobacillus fermentum]APU46539.1 CRISPR-associated helicase/endonuclease Cas3 [Limosilactobacillus fermentum]
MKELSKQVKALWGKKSNVDGQELWQPLVVHLLDTKNVINWLYSHWLTDGQRKVIQGNLSEEAGQQLTEFLGVVHDLGKATPVFQTKKSYNGDQDLDDQLMERLIQAGFDHLGELILASPRESPHALAGEALLEQFGIDKTVGAIIGGHHGKPQSKVPRGEINDHTKNYWQVDNLVKAQEGNWLKVQRELFSFCLQECGYQSIVDVPTNLTQPQAVLLEGLLIMADWMASTEYLGDDKSKPLFPLIPLHNSMEDLDLDTRFQRAILTWRVEDQWFPEQITDIDEQFQKRWGFNPHPVQCQMDQVIQDTTDPGIIIIELEPGAGKTEIALEAVEQLAYTNGEQGLFFGLPTQATSNAMFDRVNDWLAKVAKDDDAQLGIKLMHSKAEFNPTYADLKMHSKAEFNPTYADLKIPRAHNVEGERAVTVNSWFSGKKSILEEFSIGTIDHLLLMGLKQKHLFLRHLGMSGKVVVIDEVHAYDAYMDSYLTKALEWLGAYHVPVIALSATLPIATRNALIEAYCKGKYGKKKIEGALGWDKNQAYPLISVLDGKRLVQKSDFTRNTKGHAVAIERLTVEDGDLIKAVLEAVEDGGVAGVIVNTVKRVQMLASQIPEDIPKLILHSAFLAPDRAKIETKLQGLIGKHGKRPKKMIIIGTQVLEQSLDIDFDIMFTDIAPMDLLIQRIGRLHRHDIQRPSKLVTPQVKIMGINDYGDYGSANEAIYSKYLLMKTDQYLPEQLTIPDDISPLVQATYRDDGEMEPDLREAKRVFDVKHKEELDKAKKFQIKLPKQRESLHGWLDSELVDANKDEVRAQAAVRDIQETLEVLMVKQVKGDYYLLDGQQLEEVDSKTIAQQLIRIPAAVTPRIDKSIELLETQTAKSFPDWQADPWLKGALVVVLDEQNSAELGNWRIHYSRKFGLSYEKADDDEKQAF